LRSLTPKQMEILKTVVRANPDGTFVDLDQLCERLSYKPTKEALQFSIRFLIGRGLIDKKDREVRRGAKRRVLAATGQGYAEYRELLAF